MDGRNGLLQRAAAAPLGVLRAGAFPTAVLCGAEPENLFPELAQEIPGILFLHAEAEWERESFSGG